MAVRAVRDGMTQADAARTYGVRVFAGSDWMRRSREVGLKALRRGKRGRRNGKGQLNPAQAGEIRKLIIE
jgi:transposase